MGCIGLNKTIFTKMIALVQIVRSVSLANFHNATTVISYMSYSGWFEITCRGSLTHAFRNANNKEETSVAVMRTNISMRRSIGALVNARPMGCERGRLWRY